MPRFGLAVVRGRSMEPTLRAGDRVLVDHGRTAVPGRLAVVWLPGRSEAVVKRVLRRDADGWWVERDNPREGVDSWHVGAVPTGDVLGLVLARVWPRPRILRRRSRVRTRVTPADRDVPGDITPRARSPLPPAGPPPSAPTPGVTVAVVPVLVDPPADPSDADPAFALHRGGKLEVRSTVPLRNRDDLSLAYTPGVARVCMAIAEEPDLVHDLTWKGNAVAVVTDGTAVLGLGDIGPEAALPVMEGKALLFKEFGGVDAVPICLDCHEVDDLVDTVARLAPGFGGINLEDISAPRCFEVERRVQERVDIPVFHDDQHGTAIVVSAALLNAARLTGHAIDALRVVISGAGAAGVAVTRMLLALGVDDILVLDRRGVIHAGRDDLTSVKRELAAITNRHSRTGRIADALRDADVLVGVSGGSIPEAAVAGMAPGAIVFALANPDPEVAPDVARRHAAVVATGRSDHPNQINNVLAFPGVFRGALAVRAARITEGMKLAAAEALADLVGDQLAPDFVVASPFDRRIAPAVAAAVAGAARAEGVARR